MFSRINQFIHISTISTILIFLNVETSFDKKKNRNYTHIKSFISNKQINIQNIKQKIFELRFVSFRFCLNDLFVSTTFNEFATTINESVSMKFLMNRLKRFQNACVRFFTFLAINTSMKNESITYNDTKTNDITRKVENIESIDLLFNQINSFFSQSFARRRQ